MLVILDRDGVINQDSPNYIRSPEQWHAIPGSLSAIASLKHAGHTVCVATNQSGIARGYFSLRTLSAIHQKMQQQLQYYNTNLDAITFCPHVDSDHCQCRKPKPGLITYLQQQFNTDNDNTWMIGDSLKDLQAAGAAGCRCILVATGNGQRTYETNTLNVPFYQDLKSAVDWLLSQP